MGSIVLGTAGAIVGGIYGGPTGAKIGWAIGSAIGGMLDPPKTQKQVQPLTDLKVIGTEYGQPIPYVRGSARVSGQMWWNTDRRAIPTTTSSGGGKGAGQPKSEVTTYSYEIDALYGLTDNEIIGVSRIWDNGDLIYANDAAINSGAVVASGDVKQWTRLTVYTGADGQLPDPTYEAAVGVGNAPAYLGRGTVFIEGLQLGQSGSLRNLTFEVVVDGSSGSLLRAWEQPSGFTASIAWNTSTANVYNPILNEIWTVDGQYNANPFVGPCRITIFDLATEAFIASVSFPDLTSDHWHISFAYRAGIPIRYIPQWGQVIVLTGRSGNPNANWSWYDAASRAYICNMIDASPQWAAIYTFEQRLLAIDPDRNVAAFTWGSYQIDFWSLGDNHCPLQRIINNDTSGGTGFDWGVVASDGTFWLKHTNLGPLGEGWAYFEAPGYVFQHFAFDSDGMCSLNADNYLTYDASRNCIYYWAALVIDGGNFKTYLKKLDCATQVMTRLNPNLLLIRDDVGGAAPIFYDALTDKIIVQNPYVSEVLIFDPADGSYISLPVSADALTSRHPAFTSGVLWAQGTWPDAKKNLNEFRFNALTNTCPSVPAIVSDLCTRTGLAVGQIDVTALASITRSVCCMPVSQIAETRQVLELLMNVFFFEMTISDKLYFVPRGGAINVGFAYYELGAGMAEMKEPFTLREVNELEIPAQVALTYINIDNDYQQDTQYSDRIISAVSGTVNAIQMAIGMTPSEAKAVADVMLMDQSTSRASATISVLGEYLRLEPTDIITVTGADASTFRMRIVQKTDAYPMLEYDLVLDDATVLVSQGITSADYISSTSVDGSVNTLLYLLDIPILLDEDDNAGFYAAAKGLSSPYPGCAVFDSDNDVDYAQQATIGESAVMGTTTTRLGNWHGPRVFDEMNTVTVNVGVGLLASSTRALVLNSLKINAIMIGSEMIQFTTATLITTGVYTLSGLLRGGRGTEWAMVGHSTVERVVLLREAGLRRIVLTNADLGVARYYKGVTLGRAQSTASPSVFTNTAVGLKPFSPIDGRVTRDGSNNATITIQPRTRLGVRMIGSLGISVPEGETVAAYELDIMSEASPQTVLRTLTSSTPSFSYTAAQQTTDGLTPGNPFTSIAFHVSSDVARGYGYEFTG